MCSNSLQIEDVFIQVRDKLQKDGVKLWLPPYYDPQKSSTSAEDMMVLGHEFSRSLSLPFDHCYAAISELQSSALEKLKQRDRFKQSGVASLKVKVLNQKNNARLLNKDVLLTVTGLELKSDVAKDISTVPEKLKLICSGKVLIDSEQLNRQGVQNGHQILAIMLAETPAELEGTSETYKEAKDVKSDTELLVDDDDYMMLEDQEGNAVNIPIQEKKALMVAMALHAKGHTAVKNKDYARALIFLLNADSEFRQCDSKLLDSVDNYALLDLDIAWCYLCLQSVQHLPEAYDRLVRCEQRFYKSYGPKMERLIRVKGALGNEEALLMRLHLLKGIVLYHQNKREESLAVFRIAEEQLKNLKVDEKSLFALSQLGYSTVEARLGLRMANGDVNLAANYINEMREKRAQSRKKAEAERILRREKKKLGKCIDGKQYVEPSFIKMLINMGYNKEAARVALQKTNNIISDSIQYLQENPHPGPSGSKSQEMLSLINDMIPELEAAGFDRRMARLALKKHMGDVMKAAEDLLENDGVIECDLDGLDDEYEEDRDSGSRKKKKEEAFQRLARDISMVEDDHLDLDLQEEEDFLRQYLSLLEKNE